MKSEDNNSASKKLGVKKASKKETIRASGGGESMARRIAAVEALQAAVADLASEKA